MYQDEIISLLCGSHTPITSTNSTSKAAFTCEKLTIETLEEVVKFKHASFF